MGIRAALRLVESMGPSSSATTHASAALIPSPATVDDFPVEIAAAFGLGDGAGSTITRRKAMTVPAVKRGRNVIASTIGSFPLVASRAAAVGVSGPAGAADELVDRQLLVQPDPQTTLQHVLTWTVDDLIFGGVSWWRVLDRDATSYPTAAARIAPERVGVSYAAGRARVTVDGDPVDDADLIRFDGPDEGVIRLGARTLLTCIRLEEAVYNFARLDVPLGSIEPLDGTAELDEDEIDALLDGWESARRDRTTAYLKGSKYVTHQLDARQLQLAEARQAQAAEVARLLNLAPRYVGAPSGDSMTYSTTEADRRELVDLSLSPYFTAIEQRLSLGDVTPRTQVVRFDLSSFLRGDLTAVTAAIDAGLSDAAEGRAWLRLRPRTDLPARPAPTTPGAP